MTESERLALLLVIKGLIFRGWSDIAYVYARILSRAAFAEQSTGQWERIGRRRDLAEARTAVYLAVYGSPVDYRNVFTR